jgi:diketogulonate reductase-like aldo/keto reductase
MTGSIRDCVTLNNGIEMPLLGFGVLGVDDHSTVVRAVLDAIDVGYRSIDTASVYGNERGVGEAIRQSDVRREDLFITTKVWNDAQREGRTLTAFDESLARLDLEYVDLYLVHWPVEGHYKQTWQELESIYQSGRARAIGVCNFMPHHINDLLTAAQVTPSINQVEFHPLLVQPELMQVCQDQGIQLEAWGPLMKGHFGSVRTIVDLAARYRKTPAQVVLRWHLQHGVVAIPKSSRRARIIENADLYDFVLDAQDMDVLDALNAGKRFGPDPYDFDF